MKTPQEWEIDFAAAQNEDPIYSSVFVQNFVHNVQQDAYQQGIRDAIEVVRSCFKQFEVTKITPYKAAIDLHRVILIQELGKKQQ